MLDLSTISFKVDTTELDRAGKAIGELVTNVGKLDKAARDAAQTEAILARAAKDNAKANLDNAKAQDTRLKSTIAADKADQQASAAIEKKTKATEKANEATAKNVGVLQKQKDILEFQTQGFSKGQSSILAYGKAAGLAADDISELGKVLETQRKLMGGDPFDKSLSGLKSLQNQYTELKESVRQYNTDSNLSAKQTRELARDKERLIEKMKVEGASFSEIRKAVRLHNDEYVKLATSYNKMTSAEDAVIKSRKDAVNATNYLTQADQKMAAALATSNATLDKAGTDSLVKYETALRKSGLTQDVIVSKLATYKTQLTQVTALEKKRQEQHLARALSPQLTDIGVSLYSGQAPMTVLLQQGGQIADLLRLSGVEAQNFGKALRDAFSSMIPVMATVAKGLGQFAFGLFQEAGAGVVGFIGKITGISAAMDIAKRAIASGGEENFKYIASLQRIGAVASTVAATGIAALIALLVTMALEYKKIIETEKQLSVALATSGGAMAMSKDQAVAYAEGMQSIGVGTLKAMNAITEFAKAGKIGKDGLDLIIKSALDLEKYAGVSIAETAKQYAKLQDEPSKALTEIAEKTGLVDKATLDYVYSLEQQGDKTKAAEEATKALTAANTAMAGEIKGNLSPIEQLWNDITSAIGKAKQEIYDLTTSNANVSAMRVVWQSLAVTVSEFWFVLKGVGRELGGIAAQVGAMDIGAMDMLNPAALAAKIATGFNSDAAKNIRKEMITDAEAARKAQDALVASIMNQGNEEKKNFSEGKEQNSQYAAWRKENEKALERQFSKEERLGQKKKQLQNDLNSGLIDEVKYKQALAGWERIIMGEKKPKPDRQAIKDLETEIDLRNKDLGLLASFNNELDAIERRRAKTGDEDQYQASLNALIEKQPIYLERQKEINAAHDLENRLLGEADMLGKSYYKTLEEIQKNQDSGLYSPEKAEKLRQAEFERTKLFKEQLKYITDSTEASQKYAEEVQKSLGSNKLQNELLDDRVAALGLTSEQARILSREQERKNKLLKVELDYQEKILKIKNDEKLDPWDKEQAMLDAARVRAEEEKTINREVAVQYAEDLDKEIRAIKSGITDSIVTALFEGGKAGSKKLRDVLVNVLRQKITMVVDVGVNAFMNSIMGGIFGGSGGAASGGGGILGLASNASTLYSAGTSAYGLINSGAGLAGWTGAGVGSIFGQAAGNAALGTMVTGDMASSIAAANAASAAGGGSGVFGMGGSGIGSSGMGALGAGGAFMAAAAVILNGLGAFRSDRRVASGLRGTLGSGEISPWEEWREGGTLFSGPEYSTFNPVEALTRERTRLQEMQSNGTDPSRIVTQQMIVDNLEDQYGDVAEAAKKQSDFIQKTFGAMKDSAIEMGKALGLNTDKLKDFTTLLGGEKGINLEGLNPQEQQAKIAEALATANNDLAQQIIGSWETTTHEVSRVLVDNVGSFGEDAQLVYTTVTDSITETKYVTSEYAKEGEKAIDTLTRLALSITTVNGVFDMLGYTLYEASLAGADLASKLVDAFGSMDSFVASTSYYFDNFYSENERYAASIRKLEAEFGKQNLTLPKSREEYRKLVEAQDLATEEGRKMYAFLLGLAPMFADVTKSQEDLIKAEQERAKEAVEAWKQQQRELLNVQIDAVQKQIDIFQRLFDFLDEEVKKLYSSVESTAKMQVAEAQAIILKAQTTKKLPDAEILQDAVGTITGSMTSNKYATRFEMERDKLRFAAQLDDLRDVADKNLKSAKNSFDALKLQLEQLDQLNVTSIKQLNALIDIEQAVKDIDLTGESAPHKPGQITTGGGGGGSVKQPNVTTGKQYSTEEALSSFANFKDWYLGVRKNADPSVMMDGGYKVPDWLKVAGLADDSTDEELLTQYMFYKNNPQYVKDFEQINKTGRSSFGTDGSTIAKSDLSKMPAEIAEYFKKNPETLLSYEGFGMDPVLAYKLYKEGPGQFGLDKDQQNFTEWLRNNKWTEAGVVANDNVKEYAHKQYGSYKLPKWDNTTGTIVDLDGSIYSPTGEMVGTASLSQMEQLYGKDFISTLGRNYSKETRSRLYMQQIGSGSTELDYYNAIRANLDKAINDGWSAQQITDAIRQTGASIQDVARAYGTTPDVIRQNLTKGGAINIPGFATGGYYPGGLAMVGEEGPELINFNRPGYVHTARETAAMTSQGAVVECLNKLNDRVEMLEANTRSTAISNAKIERFLNRLSPDGDSLQVKTVEGSVTAVV